MKHRNKNLRNNFILGFPACFSLKLRGMVMPTRRIILFSYKNFELKTLSNS